ncbi:MAG TPA: hypothetical protein VFG10_15785 [Saprospiraceae bacterium]|nr:hypothetical protein [Saprospiraceae bacterium]
MKNLTRFFTALLCLTICFPVYSQIDFKHFPIESYKLPDIQWKGLTISGSMSGQLINENAFPTGYNNNSSAFSLRPALTYFGFTNRSDLQSSYTISTSPDVQFNHSKNENNDRIVSSHYFLPDVRYSLQRLKYHGNSFFELGTLTNVSYFYSKTREVDDAIVEEDSESDFIASISVPIGFGKGRIEPLADIEMALFLLKDAVSLGLDSNLIHTDDVFAFAELMATVRNQRIFDTRRHRIAELRQLYDFMITKNWVLPSDPGFFTVLTDNWFYNFYSGRYSGNRWTYLLTPHLSYESRQRKLTGFEIPGRIIQSLGADISVQYEHFKPQSLYRNFHRQHTISTGISNYLDKNNNQKTNITSINAIITNRIGYGWFPNSRTQIYADLNVDYAYYRFINASNANLEGDQHIVRPSLSGTGNYFVSYKTRVQVSASLGYLYNTGGNISSIGQNIINFTFGSDRINALLSVSLVTNLF